MIPVTPKLSKVRFQHNSIDLTNQLEVSDEGSYISILGSSDEEYRPLHGNRTPRNRDGPEAPVPVLMPVYSTSLRSRRARG